MVNWKSFDTVTYHLLNFGEMEILREYSSAKVFCFVTATTSQVA